jgi:hypothetical protein
MNSPVKPVSQTFIEPENRYFIKWVNGIWTIFDRVKFDNVEPDLGTLKNAQRVFNGA